MVNPWLNGNARGGLPLWVPNARRGFVGCGVVPFPGRIMDSRAMGQPPPFDIAIPAPRVGPTPRWIRVRAGETWLADSRRASLLAWYGPGMLPTYCFPADDVRVDLLREGADG